jgi:tetratricopeptide (TPR) repeat protein
MKTALLLLLNLVPLLLVMGILGWVLWRWFKRSNDPVGLLVRWIVTGIVVGLVLVNALRARDEFSQVAAVLVGAVGGLIIAIFWAPKIGEFFGGLFGALYDGGGQLVDEKPAYSMAQARRKRGRYTEAIAEVRGQLEKFPADFTGWMMLAEIHAEDLKDLPGAQAIVSQLIAQEGRAPKNIAYALSREADWCLKLTHDRDGARAALERIVQLLPETEEAHLALQRIAHLTPAAMLEDQRQRRRITLKRSEENLGLRGEPLMVKPPEEDPADATARLVQHLEEFPYDNEAREKLALLYARHYQRLELAIEQLEQLITFPHQPARQVVRWLNLQTDLQIEFAGDVTTARQTLQRIVDLFPGTAAAENALSRMAHLRLELRTRQVNQSIKLGSYEQNLGLKGEYGPKRPAD